MIYFWLFTLSAAVIVLIQYAAVGNLALTAYFVVCYVAVIAIIYRLIWKENH
jgi:hypothetical protein